MEKLLIKDYTLNKIRNKVIEMVERPNRVSRIKSFDALALLMKNVGISAPIITRITEKLNQMKGDFTRDAFRKVLIEAGITKPQVSEVMDGIVQIPGFGTFATKR